MGFECPETRGRDFSEKSDIFEAGLEDPSGRPGRHSRELEGGVWPKEEEVRRTDGPDIRRTKNRTAAVGTDGSEGRWEGKGSLGLCKGESGGVGKGRERALGTSVLRAWGRGHHSLQERSEGFPAAPVVPVTQSLIPSDFHPWLRPPSPRGPRG